MTMKERYDNGAASLNLDDVSALNIERPTSNVQHPTIIVESLTLDVGR
jgi:hypothetical protein